MQKLSGKTAVVVGGTGSVGEGIVKMLLKEGAIVIVPVHNQEKVHRLVEYVPDVMEDRLITVEVDLADEAAYQYLGETINWRFPRLDIVVASVGGWWQGAKFDEMAFKDWQKVLRNNLTAHFLTAKTFIPRLSAQSDGLYVMVNGGASEKPIPNAGAISVMAAAQRMMTSVYALENADNPVRIHSLVLTTPVITRNRSARHPDWISAEEAGEYVTGMYLKSVSGADQLVHRLPLPKS